MAFVWCLSLCDPQIRRYCEEGEDEWATAVEFLDEEDGTGWVRSARSRQRLRLTAGGAPVLITHSELSLRSLSPY